MISTPHQSPELPSLGALNDTLHETGYCWLRRDWSFEDFRDYCAGLGEIFFEADVRLGAERPRNFQLPQAIGFHTDHVSARIVAWYCIEPEPEGGAMWLLDLAPVARRLSAEDLDNLSRVRVPDNAIWSTGGDLPLRQKTNGRAAFHYVPWLDIKAPDAAARAALGKLQTGIGEAEKSAVIVLDVAPGDAVIVDNHRIMHGRAAIARASRRFLKRLWIRDRET